MLSERIRRIESFDGFDYHEPPGLRNMCRCLFCRRMFPRRGSTEQRLSPAGQPGYTFDILLAGTTDAPVQFAAVTESDLPPGYRVILVDPQTSEAYDVLDRPTITLPTSRRNLEPVISC